MAIALANSAYQLSPLFAKKVVVVAEFMLYYIFTKFLYIQKQNKIRHARKRDKNLQKTKTTLQTISFLL